MLNISPSPHYLYKIITQTQWASMRQHGIHYHQGSLLDQRDGYLHMSTSKQVERIANKYFGDLINGKIIKLSYQEIESNLKWEPNSKGEYFPHGYDEIPMRAVIEVYEFSIHDFDFNTLEY